MPPADELEPRDPRVYLALERTFLSWIRTGLALMGFGFIVARFGVFLREMGMAGANPPPESAGLSVYVGTALVFLGVAVNVFAVIVHVRMVGRWNRGDRIARKPSALGIAIGILLAAAGAVMGVYLLVYR
jgi:putative membrane protein